MVNQELEGCPTIGALNYLFCTETRILRSKLTIVDNLYRKQGLATLLWEAVIKEHSPVMVSVSTVSNAGDMLILSLKRKYPRIEWDLW
jgi:hypothetical protein